MAIDLSGIFLFMPVFSFLFVLLIVYSVLSKTKVLGESNGVNLSVSFIMAIIFMSFSSLDFYVRTIVPWFMVLLVCIFLVMLIAGFSGKIEDIFGKHLLGWISVIILVGIFLIAAIYVFNPVFHPDLIITSGEGTSLLGQLRSSSNDIVLGTLLLLVVSGAVAWALTRKGK